MTVSKGLLVRLEAKHGQESAVEAFLASALPLVQQEAGTTAWFAIRFGRGQYGIFDVFADEAGRDAHLGGPVAQALGQHAATLFAEAPSITKLDVLADKLPAGPLPTPNTKAVLLTFQAKEGHEAEVAQFLRDAQPLAQAEPGTTAWFALQLPNNEFGIFDTFPDNGARIHHLIGQIPQELVKHSLTLLGSVPDLTLIDVLTEMLG